MRLAANAKHNRNGAAFTELILEVFRLHGRVLNAGDELTKGTGLTSARWQVIGAIALAEVPLPVAHIARIMGLTRQSVQRIVNELESEGLVEFAANPHHERAQLVMLTRRGLAAYNTATSRQVPWANRVASGVREKDLRTAVQVIRTLAEQLESAKDQP